MGEIELEAQQGQIGCGNKSPVGQHYNIFKWKREPVCPINFLGIIDNNLKYTNPMDKEEGN